MLMRYCGHDQPGDFADRFRRGNWKGGAEQEWRRMQHNGCKLGGWVVKKWLMTLAKASRNSCREPVHLHKLFTNFPVIIDLVSTIELFESSLTSYRTMVSDSRKVVLGSLNMSNLMWMCGIY